MPMLGIMASGISGNLWAPAGAYDSIATTTLSTSAANITFSSIPQTYTHLQIRYLCNTTRVGGPSGSGTMEFNGDTTAGHYSTHALYGDGATAAATGYANANYGVWYYGSTTTFVAGVIDILDYTSTTKNKTQRILTGFDANGSGQMALASTLWMATSIAGITSIVLTPTGYSFNTYSSFALYGVK